MDVEVIVVGFFWEVFEVGYFDIVRVEIVLCNEVVIFLKDCG